jgi:hypothetical protein
VPILNESEEEFHMFHKQPLTLGGAERLIENYLKQEKSLSVEEIAIFYEIKNRCKAISNQKGWMMRGSLLADYWARKIQTGEIKKEEGLTQQALIDESKKIHLDMVNYTIFALQKLKDDFEKNQFGLALISETPKKSGEPKEDGEEKKEAAIKLDGKLFKEKHSQILSEISKCWDSVLTGIMDKRMTIAVKKEVFPDGDKKRLVTEKNESEREHWDLTEEEEKFFQCKKDDFILAEKLHGIFYPFAQRFDPLRGEIYKEEERNFLEDEEENDESQSLLDNEGKEIKEKKSEDKDFKISSFEGACHGHALVASYEIQKSGKSLLLPRYDKETLIQFESQDDLKKHAEKYPQKAATTLKWTYSDMDQDKENIAQNIENLFNVISFDINKDYIYGVIMEKPLVNGHMTQIRCIPSTNEIEYNDSNLGIFVFPTIDTFNYWFTQHVVNGIQFFDGVNISLVQLGRQPQNASASIPVAEVKNQSDKKRTPKDEGSVLHVETKQMTVWDLGRKRVYEKIKLIIDIPDLKTSTIKDIHHLIKEQKKYSDIESSRILLPALLKKISARCEENATSESARFFRGRSVMANELYEILKGLKNPHDKRVLKNVDTKLTGFIDKYVAKKAADPKPNLT